MSNRIRHVRQTVRGLRRTPAFAAIAVATLALAIGANTATLSLVRAVLLRPLPYPRSDRLVAVAAVHEQKSFRGSASAPDFLDWEAGNRVFSGMAAYYENARSDEPSAQVLVATRDYFRTVGNPLRRGRLFTPADAPGSPRAVLANKSAARRFWPSGDALGQRLEFGARRNATKLSGEIVGVVGDVWKNGLDRPTPPIYSFDQTPIGFFTVVLGAAKDPVALAATSLFRSLLFDVSATDPLVFGANALLLLSIAAAACFLPARRAARVDPVTALKPQ